MTVRSETALYKGINTVVLDVVSQTLCTALIKASQYGHAEVVQTLLNVGANMEAVNRVGGVVVI